MEKDNEMILDKAQIQELVKNQIQALVKDQIKSLTAGLKGFGQATPLYVGDVVESGRQTAVASVYPYTVSYPANTQDFYIGCTNVNGSAGTAIINLPAISSVSNGDRVTVKDETSTASGVDFITLNLNGADTVEGSFNQKIENPWGYRIFQRNAQGTEWIILGSQG